MSETLQKIYALLVDLNYFTEEELNLLLNINGHQEQTLNDAIYVRYGFHDVEQLASEDGINLKDWDL